MNDLIVVEKLAEWPRLKALVLDSVSSPITRHHSMARAWSPASRTLILPGLASSDSFGMQFVPWGFLARRLFFITERNLQDASVAFVARNYESVDCVAHDHPRTHRIVCEKKRICETSRAYPPAIWSRWCGDPADSIYALARAEHQRRRRAGALARGSQFAYAHGASVAESRRNGKSAPKMAVTDCGPNLTARCSVCLPN